MKKLVAIVFLVFLLLSAYGQLENPYIRKGNRLYKKGKYSQSEAQYSLALKKNPNSFIAKNNLGIAFFKENNDTSALATLSPLLGLNYPNTLYRSEAAYNLGDVLTRMAGDSLQVHNINGAIKYLQKAVRAYRNSVKFNPEDYQARYNLWITQKLLDSLQQQQRQQNKGGGKNNQRKEQNNQQKKNQDKKQNQNQKDQQNQNKKQNQNQNNQQKQKKQFQGLSQQEIERMLRAVGEQDKRVQQKAMRNLMKIRNRRKTDKNW